MSDLITLQTPDIPMSAAEEIANTWGTGDSLETQVDTFRRNNPQAVEMAAELGMDLETYYLTQIIGADMGQSGVSESGDAIQPNFLQNIGKGVLGATKGIRGAAGDALGKIAAGAAMSGLANTIGVIPALLAQSNPFVQKTFRGIRDFGSKSLLTPGERSTARQEYYQNLGLDPFQITDTSDPELSTVLDPGFDFDTFQGESFNQAFQALDDSNTGGSVGSSTAASSMGGASAGGFVRDDMTGSGTFMGGANTLMADDQTINYDTTSTETTGTTGTTGTSEMDSRLEEYYRVLREQGPEAAEVYAQNLDAFVQGVSPILFGAARDYSGEQLRSLGRTVGISYDDDRVPTLQEITAAGAALDPTESMRIQDVLTGGRIGSGRQFDSSISKAAIDFNQLMYGRREPFIRASIAASDIGPGIQFGGGIAGTMEGALPTFADQYKIDLAQQQMGMQERMLEAQEKAGDINTGLAAYQALFGPSGAYSQNLFGVQDLVDTTLQNLGLGAVSNFLNPNQSINRFSDIGENNSDLLDYDNLIKYYLTGGR